MGKRTGHFVRLAVLAAAAALALSACSSVVDGTPTIAKVPNANLKVIGDSGSSFDVTAKNALSDVIGFWKQNYPKVSGGKALPPIKGGLYSIDGAQVVQTKQVSGPAAKEACIQHDPSFIIDNAAFCLLDDSIVWDRNPSHLVGVLANKYGSLIIALVFAHEFGHAIQHRLNIDPDNRLPTIDVESQADCAAGAFIGAAFKGDAPHFRSTPAQLDSAVNGFLQIRDSTPESPEDISHGNGFDRISAIEDGISKGVTFCYSANYFNRTFTERPFVTDTQSGITDAQNNGNETLAQVLNPGDPASGGGGLQPDLNRFWKQAAASINKTWKDVKIAEAEHPKCDSNGPSEFGYCPDDNTVYYNADFAKQAYYSLTDRRIDQTTANVTLVEDQPADFSLGALFAIGWGMAVRSQLFNRSIDDTAALTSAICYTGAYAKDINVANTDNSKAFTLSPPDMDEATSAVLNVVNDDRAFGARGTTGVQRVQSFVKGYGGGLSVC
jgi:predicted metalloprotease